MLLIAVPLLWPGVPPLTERPESMGGFRGMLGVGRLATTLTPLLGTVAALKAIAVAIPVLAVAGMLWLSREAHGRVQPSAYGALPFAYNPAFLGGLLDASLAMALALNAFAWWLRLGRQRRLRLRAVVFVGVSALVWTANPFGWLALGAITFAAELARERAVEQDGARRGWIASGWRAARTCLPLAPPALMLLAGRAGAIAPANWLEGLMLKPGWLMMTLRDRWWPFDTGCTILAALLLYRSYGDRRLGHAPMLGAAGLGLLVLFVALPFASDDAGIGLAAYAIVLGLLSIRFNAWVKQRVRRDLAVAAIAFLVIRVVADTASFAIAGADRTGPFAARDPLGGPLAPAHVEPHPVGETRLASRNGRDFLLPIPHPRLSRPHAPH